MAKSFEQTLKVLLLIVANGSATVFVVMYGKVFCNYGYAFSFSVSISAAVFNYVVFVLKHRKLNVFVPFHLSEELRDLHPNMRSKTFGILHRQAILAGLFWATNYVCVTAANPFVTGLYQVAINESNLVVVFIASMVILGNRYHKSQWFCFMLVLAGGSMPLMGSSSGEIKLFWFFVYLAHAWGVGLAHLVIENVMHNLYIENAVGKKTNLISAAQFLTLANLYSVLWSVALFWVPLMANPDNWFGFLQRGAKCLWMGQCLDSDMQTCDSHGHPDDIFIGICCMWVAAALNGLCALISANIQRDNDVVYVTVAMTLAPILSMFAFLVHVSRLYDPPTRLAITSNIVVFMGGFGYKLFTHCETKSPAGITTITKAFRFEPIRKAGLAWEASAA